MSYFPEDIPFMSKEELRENGIRIPKDVTDTNVGDNSEIPNSSDCISRQAATELAMKYCPDDDGAVQCDGDIRGLLDELENSPPAQPEPSIPVAWIEGKIEWLNNMDNYFAELTANIIKTMLNEWRKGQTDNVD